MSHQLKENIGQLLGSAPVTLKSLSGGSVGQVFVAILRDGSRVVAKVANGESANLSLEGYMLDVLASETDLPVPKVYYCDDHLLLIEFVDGSSVFNPGSQRHAARLLASLHNLTAAAYGLERDTLIGGLDQPNPWTTSWLQFFREQRLLYMGEQSFQAGRLPGEVLTRLRRFSEKLDLWLYEPSRPALIHGDAWTGNILAVGDRITAFLDPAIYYADPEIELAFTTLFGTFDSTFFECYHELRPIRPSFFDIRRDIYNLYPLLVHTRLFGGGYVTSVSRTLSNFGF